MGGKKDADDGLALDLGGRFGSKTKLVFDEFSSSVFMLIYVDFRRIWEHFGPHFRDFWHPKSTSDRFMKNHRNHWRGHQNRGFEALQNHQKTLQKQTSISDTLFTDFSSILAPFVPHKRSKNPLKNGDGFGIKNG